MDGPDAKAYANRMLTHDGTSACDRIAVRMSRMYSAGGRSHVKGKCGMNRPVPGGTGEGKSHFWNLGLIASRR